MIIKILSSTGTFAAVRYNTNKMDKGDGELMKVGNIPHFEDKHQLSPDEVKAYLKAHSSTNTRIKNAQFHAVISANGKELDKHQLTDVAIQYLDKMGYGENPYIVVFHSDTENNHVHIVSSRVDNYGKKINDSNERFRSQSIRNELMQQFGIKDNKDLENLLSYKYQNPNQLIKLLEHSGYSVIKSNDSLEVKFNGETKALLNTTDLEFTVPEQKRINQLQAIIMRYKDQYSTELIPIHEKLKGGRDGNKVLGYRSDFGDFMKTMFGVEFVYHFSDNKPPFGYTIFDHSQKTVLKGSDVRKLNMILSKEGKRHSTQKANTLLNKVSKYNVNSVSEVKLLARYFKVPEYLIPINNRKLDASERFYYQNLLDNFFDKSHWSDINKIKIVPIVQDRELFLMDKENMNLLRADEFLSERLIGEFIGLEQELDRSIDIDFSLNISDDTDDSKFHKKKRKQQS